ncbi:MAG: bile acid:sodium symporter [Planctomycetota bacterium]
MRDFLRRRWFMIALLAILCGGITAPETLAPLANRVPQKSMIAAVLLATSLPLHIGAFVGTLRSPGPTLLATAANYALLPAVAWAGAFLLPSEFRLGLFVAVAAPCTLASAAVWTRLAGGNPATAIMVTIITNLGCFLGTPALMWLLSGRTAEGLSFVETAQKLLVLIVCPLVAGQLLRLLPPVRHWASRSGALVSAIGQTGVLVIAFVGSVYCGATLRSLGDGLAALTWQIPWMIACISAVHLAAWRGSYRAAAWFGMPREEQIAVGFAGAQKTLTVALALSLEYGGLTILPVLTHHILQLVIDTFIADRLRKD